MQKNRGDVSLKNLTDGPAKLAQALAITKEHYGIDLTENSKLHISDGIKPKGIIVSPRIGITKATYRLWNFKIQS
jgi:DNA-3-methyladenine glycosylase